MTCPHLLAFSPLLPSSSSPIHREECTLCFDSQDSPHGIDVCLHCFNGACPPGSHYSHSLHHSSTFAHPLVVNIKRIPKHPPPHTLSHDHEPPMKKLAIKQEPSEHEKYDWILTTKCYSCDPTAGRPLENSDSAQKLDTLVSALLSSVSSAQASSVKAWEEEITVCEHALTLSQDSPRNLGPTAKCAKCDLTSNLWGCLTCGAFGCGRKQFGGLDGNSHALTHFNETGHPLSFKIGTVEPEGTADIYCYACDDARLDPRLAAHLANFNIIVSDQVKTEKNMTELQVEQNLNFDFAMTGLDGKDLVPLYGPGLTGLRNLGNSCYMASVLQTLFSLPPFQQRYYSLPSQQTPHAHTDDKYKNPASCFECQMRKMADGLLSGRYSTASQQSTIDSDSEHSNKPAFQQGLRPHDFKALIGKGHPEFQTMRQQDADEFFKHLLSVLQKNKKSNENNNNQQDVTDIFKFSMQEKIKCRNCGGVRLKSTVEESVSVPVPVEKEQDQVDENGKDVFKSVNLDQCLQLLTTPDTIEYKCPKCAKSVSAEKTSGFESVPDVLVVHARRFQWVNYVPTKMDVPVQIPQMQINLDSYQSKGRQEGEEELPDEEDEADDGLPEFDATAMAQLEAMGFPTVRCQKALLATGNSDAEAAMNWLFGHMEDPDIDAPIVVSSSASTSGTNTQSQVDQAAISMLSEMGFTANQARKALRECNADPNAAVEWLFSHPDDAGDDGEGEGEGEDNDNNKEQKQVVPGTPFTSSSSASYRLAAFVSHKGPSTHSGHYVTHIRKANDTADPTTGWVLFNDEKVVSADGGAQSAQALLPFAYMYFFVRV